MVYKTCPDCEKQLPCACRTCTCGHQFWVKNAKFKTPEKPLASASSSVKKAQPENESNQNQKKSRRASLRPREMLERKRRMQAISMAEKNRAKNKRSKVIAGTRKKKKIKVKQPGFRLDGTKDRRFKTSKFYLLAGGCRESNAVIQNDEKERIDREQREREREYDVYKNIPTDKALQYSVILAEVNRKFMVQNFQPS